MPNMAYALNAVMHSFMVRKFTCAAPIPRSAINSH